MFASFAARTTSSGSACGAASAMFSATDARSAQAEAERVAGAQRLGRRRWSGAVLRRGAQRGEAERRADLARGDEWGPISSRNSYPQGLRALVDGLFAQAAAENA